MKKWRQIILVAAMAFILGMTAKTEAQAAMIEGVQQTDATESRVYVTCKADLVSKYYVMQVSTDRQSWVSKDYSSSPNSLCATGLSAGSTYYVRVIGASDYDGFGDAASLAWKFCTDASNPVEVVTVPNDDNAKLVQTNATGTKVTMQLTGVEGANYYVLGTSTSWSNNNAIYGTSTTSTITTSAALKPGTKYAMYAYACRRAASTGFVAHPSWDSAWDTDVKTVAGKINTKNFKCSSAWVNINSYDFSVSSGVVADGFHYQFQTMKGKVKKNMYKESGWSNTISVDNFINGTFWRYRVRPYVQCGTKKVYGAWSGFRYIGVTKSLGGKSYSNYRSKTKKIRMSWKKVSGASSYVVYISNSANGGYKKVKKLSAKKSSITITKYGKKRLKSGTTYYVKVVTQAKSGKKTVSSEINRTVY